MADRSCAIGERRAALGVAMIVLAVMVPVPDRAGATDESIETLPVSFVVTNVDRTLVGCPTADRRAYTLRGSLVGPRSALDDSLPTNAVTVLLHGAAWGEFEWNFPDDPAFEQSYDFQGALARAGHVSVAIDRLGYDSSPGPHGLLTCLAAHADMTSQLVGQLRSGQYALEGRAPLRFERVALGGMSTGAAIAEQVAHTFGGIDALLVFGWADSGFSNLALQHALAQGVSCALGALRPERPGGYAYYGATRRDFEQIVFAGDAEPAVMAAAWAMRNRDPCGDGASLATTFVVSSLRVPEIRVPVLVLFGTRDSLFVTGSAERQAALFSGSSDVSLALFDGAGHGLTVARQAPQVQQRVSEWLTERGL